MAAESFPELLAAAQRGDDDAFAALFRATQPSVLRYLRVVAGARADDVAGETWLQVIRGLRTFAADDISAFRAWTLSIARHRWVDELRRSSRRRESLVAEVPEPATAPDVATVVHELMSTEDALGVIGRLPRDQAEVVMLRYVADLDVSRTAEVLGKSPGAVRVLAHRGLRRLEAMLGDARASDSTNDRSGVRPDQV